MIWRAEFSLIMGCLSFVTKCSCRLPFGMGAEADADISQVSGEQYIAK
jgi:hypothetical protein